MAKQITLAEARRAAMQGNVDYRALQKPDKPEEPRPDPVSTALNGMMAVHEQSIGKMGEAMWQVSEAMDTMAKNNDAVLREIGKVLRTQDNAKSAPCTWEFNVTKRDNDGNIKSFTARKVVNA